MAVFTKRSRIRTAMVHIVSKIEMDPLATMGSLSKNCFAKLYRSCCGWRFRRRWNCCYTLRLISLIFCLERILCVRCELLCWSDSISADVAFALMNVDLQVLRHQKRFLLVSPLLLMVARLFPSSLSKHHRDNVLVACLVCCSTIELTA